MRDSDLVEHASQVTSDAVGQVEFLAVLHGTQHIHDIAGSNGAHLHLDEPLWEIATEAEPHLAVV